MASFFIGSSNDDEPTGSSDVRKPVVNFKLAEQSDAGDESKKVRRGVGEGPNCKERTGSASNMNDASTGQGQTTIESPCHQEGNAERLIELLFCESPNGESRQLFCELEELVDGIWYESARWVRFEEDVEIGGDRWSKPFVAALPLHSIFELRHHLASDIVLLDVDVQSFNQLVTIVADKMIESKLVDEDLRERIIQTLMLRHVHQHEHAGALLKRGLSEIGKKISAWRVDEHSPQTDNGVMSESAVESAVTPTTPQSEETSFKQNESFARKLARGAEGSASLVGGVDFLNHSVSAFVRLASKTTLHECSEVSVPTRFVFILLGPTARSKDLREIGRVMETAMSDDIFRDVAYRGSSRVDLLAGLDEFVDEAVVLPPSEWDPKIRIEPPKKIPSMEARKMNVLNQISSEKSLSVTDLQSKAIVVSRALSEVSFKADVNANKPETPVAGTPMTPGTPGQLTEAHSSLAAFMDELMKRQGEKDDKEDEHAFDPALQRTGHVFGGLIEDVKRKAPWYRSDITDAFNMQCVAGVFFMFFACLAPIVTFGGLLGLATENNMAAFESILTGAICGTSYHLFAGQPITIIGSTGPVLLFEKILFSFAKDNDMNYLTLRFWIGVWTAAFLMIIVAFDLNALVSLITRFTEECFATLISVIFIFEAFIAIYGIYKANPISTSTNLARNYSCWCDWVESNYSAAYAIKESEVNRVAALESSSANPANLSSTSIDCRYLDLKQCDLLSPCRKVGPGCDFKQPVPDVFFFSCLIFIGTCALTFALKSFRTTSFFPNIVRRCVSDFAVTIAIFAMVAVDIFVGLPTPKLGVPKDFAPTRPGRPWVVEPFANPVWTIVAAPFPAFLMCVLLFMDQQITAVIVNRREHKLLKGKGYHLDLFILTLHVIICATLGLPYFVAATVLSITHVNCLRKQSETSAPGEQPRFLGLIEQRVTGFIVFALIGCAIPLRAILKFIPMPVLYGVFLFMGLSALQTSQFYNRCLLIFMPVKYQPDAPYLRHMRTWRVHMFTLIQLTAFMFLWVVKQIKQISILFILMLVIMVVLRKVLDYVFTQEELRWVDDILPKHPLAVRSQNTSDCHNGDESGDTKAKASSDGKKPKKKSSLWRRFGRGNSRESQPLQDRGLCPLPTIVVVSPSRETSVHEITK